MEVAVAHLPGSDDLRSSFGELNSFLLDSLRGLDETIQYDRGRSRMEQIDARSNKLGQMQKKLNWHEAAQSSLTNMMILLFSFGMLFVMLWNYERGVAGFDNVLIATIAMMGSFGPVVALANLSNNLSQTLASGERVLSLLEEEPQITEVSGEAATEFEGAAVRKVSFAYESEQILKDYSVEFTKGQIVGIHGASGSGKSTLLKLLMRFWDVDGGSVFLSEKNVKKINTIDLRNMESYVTQETYLFHDSIANNIAVGGPGASREEIIAAAKKASIHDFIMTLPILDEPTSNLDALNEGIILKSLQEARGDRTVVLVSHRTSTMNLADVVVEMRRGQVS